MLFCTGTGTLVTSCREWPALRNVFCILLQTCYVLPPKNNICWQGVGGWHSRPWTFLFPPSLFSPPLSVHAPIVFHILRLCVCWKVNTTVKCPVWYIIIHFKKHLDGACYLCCYQNLFSLSFLFCFIWIADSLLIYVNKNMRFWWRTKRFLDNTSYCAHFIGSSWSDLVLAAGTVFNQVVMWSPGNGGHGDCGDDQARPVLHRLTGHQARHWWKI